MHNGFLRHIRAFLLDMDGTIYLGDTLLPGALNFLAFLDNNQIPYLFLTNNSSKNAIAYQKKLQRLGIHIDFQKILTSGEASAMFLAQNYPDANIFVVGTKALIEEVAAKELSIVEENPDLVLLGFDTTLTYEKLWRLCNYVRDGLPFIATHSDINCPTEDGFMPDIGATIAFIETSTGRKPDEIIGKPNCPMLQAISQKMNIPLQKMAMIGDRLYTDIAMGELGVRTILVLSGETTRQDAEVSKYQADLIVENLAELHNLKTSV